MKIHELLVRVCCCQEAIVMVAAETAEFTETLDRITSWPPEIRITLARRVLESVESPAASQGPRRGYLAADVISLLNMPQPAPDDATVRGWIDEHRREKYGS
jgi:hypothetical protein